jgi:hypothetical protein
LTEGPEACPRYISLARARNLTDVRVKGVREDMKEEDKGRL